MTTKTNNKPIFKIALFSETALVILVSIVTLLLQSISFVTTWNGSKIYLEGVFPYASLLFAIAIQATAYFFSNSLRTRIRPLKVIALCAALCCSTYYSYIGIYNSVNSPVSYLQENYVRISQELTDLYEAKLEERLSSSREAVGTATTLVTAHYTSLLSEQQQMEACRKALNDVQISYTDNMRPPVLSSYENYEDYAAAYQAYIKGASQGSNAENAASREGVLAAYGFSSVEELNSAEAENMAELSALETAMDGVRSTQLNTAISSCSAGQPLSAEDVASLNQLFQAASLCGYNGMPLAEILSTLNLCADVTASYFMKDYFALTATLPESTVTSANTMDFKNAMDSELLSALLKINSLLPEAEQISFTDMRYQITDLYLIPVQALRNPDTGTTALFCLAVAALIDALSLLFAVSLREKKPLWKKQALLFGNLEDYAPYIYGALPADCEPTDALADFINTFIPSPQTEQDGYMMQADVAVTNRYGALAALLCQLNLAKIVPSEFADSSNPSEILLLKARFVFWANSVIYEERKKANANNDNHRDINLIQRNSHA